MSCPSCTSEGPYRIVGIAVFEVDDDGSSEFTDLDWHSASSCSCMNCDFQGIVSEFIPDDFIVEEE